MRTAKATPDGRPIVDRTPNAKVPHPHPRHQGELVATQGVNEIMLEDGTVLTECDECGKPFENPRSAVAHMTAHNPSRYGPRYPDRTLRLIARSVAIAGGAGKRGVFQEVAALLNEQGVTMLKGGKWSPNTLSHVYNLYCKEIRVRIPSRRDVGAAEEPTNGGQPAGLADRVAALTALPAGSEEDLAQVSILISSAARDLGEIGAQLVQGAKDLGAVAVTLAKLAAEQVDPEVAEKARKWDQFRQMMDN